VLQKFAASCAAILALFSFAEASAQQEDAKAGAAIYAERCVACHEKEEGRAPPRFILETRLPREIVQTLTTGPMQQQASGLSAQQIRSIALYLTGKLPGPGSEPDPNANLCASVAPVRLADGDWNGWGRDIANSRYQPQPGFKLEDLPKLKVKWAFALPGLTGQPVAAGGRLFVSSRLGRVFALDAQTGCTYWSYDTGTPVRNSVTVGPLAAATTASLATAPAPARFAAYFGDLAGTVYAVDVESGKLIWKTKVDEYPTARVVGSITLYKNRLFVPITSGDELSAADPSFSCCTFRGSLVAVDAESGKILWKSYTIPQEPKPTRMSSTGVQLYGPAGVGIWSAPTIDPKRKLIYVGTGDSYTNAPTDASDAIVAFDLDTGKRMWVSQVLKHDDWIYRCEGKAEGNCPAPLGPDFDFSSPPVLQTLPGGKEILVAGSKAATLYAFDPDARGKLLWTVKLGKGGSAAPIWGTAAADGRVFVATPGQSAEPPNAVGGMSGIDLATGKRAWHTPAPTPACSWGAKSCVHRQPEAVTLMPGAVFAGSLDGHLRAYSSKDGAILWDLDTAKDYDAVNGLKAEGGNVDGAAQTIAHGTLFVNSGNATQTSQRPGSAVLAITVDGK